MSEHAVKQPPQGHPLVTREQVEDFLIDEADLLDRWQLDEWLELFEPEAMYLVPSTDLPLESTDLPEGGPSTSLYLIADDKVMRAARVKRLKSRNAHVEFPRSRTRHVVSNVRVRPGVEPGTVRVQAAFVIFRNRREITDIYMGGYDHLLSVSDDGTLRYRQRKAVLDLDALRPSGKISIIL